MEEFSTEHLEAIAVTCVHIHDICPKIRVTTYNTIINKRTEYISNLDPDQAQDQLYDGWTGPVVPIRSCNFEPRLVKRPTLLIIRGANEPSRAGT